MVLKDIPQNVWSLGLERVKLALDRLGPAFDVQGGGSDLIFPHHEMSAAEGAAATGEA